MIFVYRRGKDKGTGGPIRGTPLRGTKGHKPWIRAGFGYTVSLTAIAVSAHQEIVLRTHKSIQQVINSGCNTPDADTPVLHL